MNLSESYKKRLNELAGIISIDELEKIAKQAVVDIGEDLSCSKEGKCAQISEEIYEQLHKRGIDCDIIEITSGYLNGEEIFTTHYYVFVYNGKIIIDTQLWQVGLQPKDLNKRKCVFTWKSYNKFFQPTETQKITESIKLVEDKQNNNEFIFHGTNNAAAYHIQKYGGMKLNAARNNEPYISFTSDLKVAQYYAQMKGGNENGVILRIKRTPDFSLSPKFEKNKGHEWITTREIPLEEIEIQTKKGWVPLKKWDIIDKKIINEELFPDITSMFPKHKLRYPNDNVLIVVNINKLLARHKMDEPDYAFDTRETSDYPGRVERAKKYWMDYAEDPRPISPKTRERKDWGDMTFEAPYITISDDGKLGFSDGRHRVIAMKELGYKDVIIEVPKIQIHLFDSLK